MIPTYRLFDGFIKTVVYYWRLSVKSSLISRNETFSNRKIKITSAIQATAAEAAVLALACTEQSSEFVDHVNKCSPVSPHPSLLVSLSLSLYLPLFFLYSVYIIIIHVNVLVYSFIRMNGSKYTCPVSMFTVR